MFPINRLMEKKILASINRVVNILIELSFANETDKSPYYDEAVNLIQEIHPLLLRLVDGKEEYLGSLIRQLVSQKLPHPSVMTSFGSLHKDLNVIISRSISGECAESEDSDLSVAQQEENSASELEEAPEVSAQPSPELNGPANDEVEPIPEYNEPVSEGDDPASASEEPLPLNVVSGNSAPVDEIEYKAKSAAEGGFLEEKIAADKLHGIVNIIYANEVLIKDYLFRSLRFDYYLPKKKLAITTLPSLQRKHLIHDMLLKKEGISLIAITPADIQDTALLSRKLRRFS